MVAIDNYTDTKKEYEIATKRLHNLKEQIEQQEKIVEDLEKTLNEIEDILKDLTGIEVSLFKEIIKGTSISKSVEIIAEYYDKDVRTIWRIYNKKIRNRIKKFKWKNFFFCQWNVSKLYEIMTTRGKEYMKYEFRTVGTDDIELTYKDKNFKFKRDVNLVREMQSIVKEARLKMIKELSSQGISLKDLVIEKKEGNKTYYDNTNKEELEQTYQNEATLEFFDNKCKQLFDNDLASLITDIGLETEEEISGFSTDFVNVLTGNTIPKRRESDKQ